MTLAQGVRMEDDGLWLRLYTHLCLWLSVWSQTLLNTHLRKKAKQRSGIILSFIRRARVVLLQYLNAVLYYLGNKNQIVIYIWFSK